MTLQLFAHPFSSYCQKVLTALYEAGTPFTLRMLSPDDTANAVEWSTLWPLKRMPLLLDNDRPVMESSIIIEHLALNHPEAASLIPSNPHEALTVRMMDRYFDNYIMTPMQRIVFEKIRPETARDPYGVSEAKGMLDTAYSWLDRHLAGREWSASNNFSLADCAAAPALFYADWAHPIGPEYSHVQAYRQRLLARPSFARAVEEARPYRPLFPLGAPDRD
ncbi:glutathione S-transferase family protein [Microvirga puerhi]|uniref:Glutathione S-transferase family protein n=1 Tax=Microvirga puerhi TaxID=2876078 RepID=A0ABS7VSH2_9HYPH|nr:glutathione S-transferase family protein [Microvirga puerhi]